MFLPETPPRPLKKFSEVRRGIQNDRISEDWRKKDHDDVSSKSQYHSLTQTIFEMTQFKTSFGTQDPFWLITGLPLSGLPSYKFAFRRLCRKTVSVRFGTSGPFRELKERIIDRCSTRAINKHNLWAKYFTSWRHHGWRLDCKLSYSVKRTTQLPMNVRWILMLRNRRPWTRHMTTLPC